LWTKLQRLLPLSVFSLACGLETAAIVAWTNDDKFGGFLRRLMVIVGMVAYSICGMAFTSLRFRKGTRRRIEIDPAGIRTSSAKFGLLPWERVTSLRLEQMGGADDVALLRIEYMPKPSSSGWLKPIGLPVPDRAGATRRKGSSLRFAVAHPRQSELVREELDRLRRSGIQAPALTTFKTPPSRVGWMWASVLGLYLILHGLPLLTFGMENRLEKPADPSASHSTRKEAKIAAKLVPILATHFRSIKELKRFCANVGAVLTAAGAALYGAGAIALFAAERREKAARRMGNGGAVG
jgi:hypothetical protein